LLIFTHFHLAGAIRFSTQDKIEAAKMAMQVEIASYHSMQFSMTKTDDMMARVTDPVTFQTNILKLCDVGDRFPFFLHVDYALRSVFHVLNMVPRVERGDSRTLTLSGAIGEDLVILRAKFDHTDLSRPWVVTNMRVPLRFGGRVVSILLICLLRKYI
jgi:hypothetical protein